MTTDTDLTQLTVICVTYQSSDIAGFMATTLQAFPRVVIVDNGSTDDTVALLRQRLPQAKIVVQDVNTGFGAANNAGMALVETPYALLLNPDCRIEPDTVRQLLDTLRRDGGAGVIAPQSWRDNGTPQKSYRQAFYDSQDRADYRVADGLCCAQWLHGCCLLLQVAAFRRIAGFDERFFLYYEDDDLCLRLGQAGYSCLMDPTARAWHKGGTSSHNSVRLRLRKHYHYARSRYLAIARYQGAWAGRRYLGKTMFAAWLAVPLSLLLWRRKYLVKWLAWGWAAHVLAFTRQSRGPR